MSGQLQQQRSAAEQARLALAADCDQRWAQAREWLWDQSALVALRLETLLVAHRRVLVAEMAADVRVADAVQHLAALALDELLARGRAEEQP